MVALAEAANLSAATIHRIFRGDNRPNDITMRKIANALDLPVDTVKGRLAMVVRRQWSPPAAIELLDDDDIQVIELMIRQLAKHRREALELAGTQ
ncbi:helix-turn-helix transcriptional regulator [Nocardia sp. NPDC004654]|uniref:helix-turn-helix domain-containing protein n=1 Tax=Nocardia sp. NPDC004654 TaxID=3154776 RepID=UPI0033ADF1BA